MKASRSSAALTPLEVFSAVAVLGLLTSILIPMSDSVRQCARSAQNMANLRECGNGLLLYAMENDNTLVTFARGQDKSKHWPRQLEEAGIVRDREVFFSPIAEHGLDDIHESALWSWRAAFGLNVWDEEGVLELETQTEPPYDELAILSFDTEGDPSSFILLADSLEARNFSRLVINAPYSGGRASIHLRHENHSEAQVYFLDGHMESAGVERLGELGMKGEFGRDAGEAVSFPQPE